MLFCRGESVPGTSPAITYDAVPADLLSDGFGPLLAACQLASIHMVGPRPKKPIDSLLSDRVLVIGDDSDLNAVVLRLLRKDLLAEVEIAYAPINHTAFTDLYALPTGPDAVRAAGESASSSVPLVRSDSGGVLVGSAELEPVTRTFYVDAQRVPGSRAAVVRVQPEPSQGLTVTAVSRRRFGLRRSTTYTGRAAEFGIAVGDGTSITFDGIRHPREVNRWVFYRHTEQLRLVRPSL